MTPELFKIQPLALTWWRSPLIPHIYAFLRVVVRVRVWVDSGLSAEEDAGASKEERAAKFVEYVGSRIKAGSGGVSRWLAPILQRLPGKHKTYVREQQL